MDHGPAEWIHYILIFFDGVVLARESEIIRTSAHFFLSGVCSAQSPQFLSSFPHHTPLLSFSLISHRVSLYLHLMRSFIYIYTVFIQYIVYSNVHKQYIPWRANISLPTKHGHLLKQLTKTYTYILLKVISSNKSLLSTEDLAVHWCADSEHTKEGAGHRDGDNNSVRIYQISRVCIVHQTQTDPCRIRIARREALVQRALIMSRWLAVQMEALTLHLRYAACAHSAAGLIGNFSLARGEKYSYCGGASRQSERNNNCDLGIKHYRFPHSQILPLKCLSHSKLPTHTHTHNTHTHTVFQPCKKNFFAERSKQRMTTD